MPSFHLFFFEYVEMLCFLNVTIREMLISHVLYTTETFHFLQQEVKRQIKEQLEIEIRTLLSPLDSLINIGGNYLNNFKILFDAFSSIKDAFTTLKTG